jgi:SHS family lactate transporter-like MFS transporter
MSTATTPTPSATITASSVAWWKEPTTDQWLAYLAAWLGWTLDAFDFTIFLLIMVPISQEFPSRESRHAKSATSFFNGLLDLLNRR